MPPLVSLECLVDVSDRTLTALGFDDVRAAIGSRRRTEPS